MSEAEGTEGVSHCSLMLGALREPQGIKGQETGPRPGQNRTEGAQ